MAGTVIDSLVVTMGLDPSEFKKGSQQVQQSVKTLSKTMPAELQSGVSKMTAALSGGLKNVLTTFVGPLTAALGGLAAVKNYTAQADAIGKLSASMGVNAEAMQAWGEAAIRAGGSAESFYSTLGTLNKTVQTIGATGKGRGKDVLDALGISVRGKDGRVREAFDVLSDLAEAAQKVGSVKFQGLAQRLGLDQGTIMLLQSGRESVEELVARQAELGGYTAEDMEATAAYNDALADLGQSMRSVSASILRYIIPPITKTMNAITAAVSSLKKHKAFVLTVVAGIGVALKGQLVAGLTSAAVAAKGLIASLAPVMPYVAALTGIALAVDDFVAWLNGGKAALSGFWEGILGKPEQVREEIEKAWNAIKEIGATVLEPLSESLGKVFDLVKSVGDLFSEVFGVLILKPLRYFFDLIGTSTGEAEGQFSLLYTVVQSIADALSLGATTVGMVADAFKAAIDWITTGVRSLGQFADFLGTLDLSKAFTVPMGWGEALLKPLRDVKAWFESFSLADILKGWGSEIAKWWSGLVDSIYQKMLEAMPEWLKSTLSFFGVSIGGATAPKVPAATAVGEAFPSGAAADVPVASGAVSNTSTVNQNRETNVNIGSVTVNTQATDSKGIAQALSGDIGAAAESMGVGT